MAVDISWQTKDGIDIYGVNWPIENPKAVVAIIHGLGEHVHRYEHFVDFLHANNYAVIGYDRRGHGRSGGNRGFTPSYEAFLEEIDDLVQRASEHYLDVPLVLYGHSMGGNLLLNYLIKRQPAARAAIVSGPHIRLGFRPNGFTVGLGKLMRNIYPGFTQPNGLTIDHISRDPAVVKKYQADPLVHDKISASTGMAMLDAGDELNQYMGELHLPTLLIHGSLDQITSPEGTRDFAERVGGDITFKMWEGLYHEMHNEPEQQEVFEHLLAWLETKV